jgi:transposase
MIARAARRIAGRFQRAGLHRSSHEPRRPEPSRESVQQELERLREILRERGERIAELEEQVEQQEKQIGEQVQEIAEAEKKIADLERQLALRQRNSTNSSKPPSSDGLAGAQRPRGCPQKKKTQRRRKPGGQKGHPGHFRPLVPVEQVQHVVDLFPDRCQGCQQLLPADPAERMTEGEPGRYQVTELPPLQPDTTEYRRHKVVCGDCGEVTQAALPVEVRGQFGPRLTALIAYLTVVCRVPRRLVRDLLDSVLGIALSLGSTQKAWEETSAAVAQPYQELEQALPQQPVLNVDETGSRTNGDKRWLWALVAPCFAFFTIVPHRSRKVLRGLIGANFAGVLCCDRFSVYVNYFKDFPGRMQFCWAHLRRNLLGALESAKSWSPKLFCQEALQLQRQLFRLWHRYRGGGSVRGSPRRGQPLWRKSIPLQKKFLALAERYLDCTNAEVRNLALALFEHHDKFFTFLEYEGVEPTNNSVERAQRPAVQWRKTSFGNRSAEGERAVSRLLTVAQTCRMQKRHVLDYLTQAIDCHRGKQPVPSLLPKQARGEVAASAQASGKTPNCQR